MKIKFLPRAQQELFETIEFYEQQLPGLGVLFSKEVAQAVEMINLFPQGWQLITKMSRKCCLHKFPYMILYGMVDDVIIISSISHQHRHPNSYLQN